MAVAGEYQLAMLCVRVVGERDVDESDRLLIAAAAGARDACDGEAEVRIGAEAHALGHRFGDFGADRAMTRN
jgi:hypothetical protein